MKKIYLTVVLETEDHINNDQEINEVAKNVLNGLIHTANNQGLVPEDSETFTRKITVKSGVSGEEFSIDFLAKTV